LILVVSVNEHEHGVRVQVIRVERVVGGKSEGEKG
jgi:hypothetical protein